MTNLEYIRKEIDVIDSRILDLLVQRLSCISKVATEKKKTQTEIFDPRREDELLKMLEKKAVGLGVSSSLVQDMWRVILKHSRDIQSKL